MLAFLKRLFVGTPTHTYGPSLPLELARRGWIPYKFPDSNVVVFLPEGIAAAHNPEGVLMGSTTGEEVEISATLHRGFEENRAGALGFVTHLAKQKKLSVRDVGTYRYFYDPTEADKRANVLRFWVIGIPGSVVVVSIQCNGETPVSPLLQEVKREIPHIVGELL
jgi:hypothetical protein